MNVGSKQSDTTKTLAGIRPATIDHRFTAEELRYFRGSPNELMMIEGIKSLADLLCSSPVDPAKPVTLRITIEQ